MNNFSQATPLDQASLPFLHGAQYYRAPTPEPSCWEYDLKRMRDMGFNHVKYWAQWRWGHRGEDRFYFDDLDRLMDLAAENELGVTINTLFDVAPSWVLKAYPDAKPITADGLPVEHRALCFRQIGGFPGPCLNHPEAAKARMHFLETTVKRYAQHPAMRMWDVWNEPEQNFVNREPKAEKLSCFCPYCIEGFREEMQKKYGHIDALNEAWGRCYTDWDEVEAPRTPETIKDFIDFRQYQLRVMEREAQARLACVRMHDPKHPAYLHVVPNTMRIFNSLTGVNDFAMAELCDLFASTSNGGAIWPNQLISAGRGKVCYNVESHINAGQISLHQRPLELNDVLSDLLPQIGAGVKGFLFWQYRPEVLGTEAPAWGLVQPDGSDRAVTRAVQTFAETLAPHRARLMQCDAETAQVAIWKSTRNELFEFSARNDLNRLADHIEGYRQWFRSQNIATINIDDSLLAAGKLDGIKLLVMPACYCLSQGEADALDTWVRAGGTLLCEAHLGAWNESTGRHSRIVPGCGLSEKWSLKELNSQAAVHLSSASGIQGVGNLNPDVIKALEAQQQDSAAQALGGETATVGGAQLAGSGYYPAQLQNGEILAAADTCAEMSTGPWEVLAHHADKALIVERSLGAGHIVYCGCNLGAALSAVPAGSDQLLNHTITQAGLTDTAWIDCATGLEYDLLYQAGQPQYLVLNNTSSTAQSLQISDDSEWCGLFHQRRLGRQHSCKIPAKETDLYYRLPASSED